MPVTFSCSLSSLGPLASPWTLHPYSADGVPIFQSDFAAHPKPVQR